MSYELHSSRLAAHQSRVCFPYVVQLRVVRRYVVVLTGLEQQLQVPMLVVVDPEPYQGLKVCAVGDFLAEADAVDQGPLGGTPENLVDVFPSDILLGGQELFANKPQKLASDDPELRIEYV